VSLLEEKNWDILGKRNYFYAFSLIIIGIGLVFWITKGLNYGVDFTGGTLYNFQTEKSLAENGVQVSHEVTGILDKLGINASAPQVYGRNQLLVRTQTKSDAEAQAQGEQILDALKQKYGPTKLWSKDLVEPVIGRYLQLMAIKALIIGCLLILLYVAIRYEFDFAVAGVIALVHDVLVMVGYFAVFHVEVDSSFVAALLTIIGYSINDTVVVFDRIRENLKLRRGESFEKVANFSMLQTMRRSIMMSVTVATVLVFLFGFGGASIRHFALAMLVGTISGSYSTVFMGASLVVTWRKLRGQVTATALQGLRSSQGRRQPGGRAVPQTPARVSRPPRAERGTRGNQPLVSPPTPTTPTAAAPTMASEEASEEVQEAVTAAPSGPRKSPGARKGPAPRKKKRRF
jgi:preprotein translocase subunit SecF